MKTANITKANGATTTPTDKANMYQANPQDHTKASGCKAFKTEKEQRNMKTNRAMKETSQMESNTAREFSSTQMAHTTKASSKITR